MATTALALITDACETLGLFGAEETLPAADAQQGLTRLNNLIGSWAIQTQTQPVINREVFPLLAGKGSSTNPYTLGPNGDLNTTRPNALTGAGLLLNSSTPVIEMGRSLLTDDSYEAIAVKDLTSALFTAVYYNPTWAAGMGTLYLWPIPTVTSNSLVLYRLTPLNAFSSLTASYDLPPGAFEALSYNLAVRLGPAYGVPISPDVRLLAISSLGTFKRANYKLSDLATDPALTRDRRGGYNIVSGQGG